MDTISLSIEELIYSFYSEGLFEQGNGLKQVYLQEATEEQLDMLLQAACRSLLAKDAVIYRNHRFVLQPVLAKVIDALHYSQFSLKASKHSQDGGEDAVSYHISEDMIVEHLLLYEGQIHRFQLLRIETIVNAVCDFFEIAIENETNVPALQMEPAEFERIITAIDQDTADLEMLMRTMSGQKLRFVEVLRDTKGFMNTLVFLEFADHKQPEAKDIVMFTTGDAPPWIITKANEIFAINECSRSRIREQLNVNLKTVLPVEWQ